MSEIYIKSLLEKYFEGNTSLEEEKQLHQYFLQAKIAEELLPYKPLFDFFGQQAALMPSSNLLKNPLEKYVPPSNPGSLRTIIKILAAAACLLLTFSIWRYFQPDLNPKSDKIDWSQYEPATVEEAFKVTHAALVKVATELNKGTGKAAESINRGLRVGKGDGGR